MVKMKLSLTNVLYSILCAGVVTTTLTVDKASAAQLAYCAVPGGSAVSPKGTGWARGFLQPAKKWPSRTIHFYIDMHQTFLYNPNDPQGKPDTTKKVPASMATAFRKAAKQWTDLTVITLKEWCPHGDSSPDCQGNTPKEPPTPYIRVEYWPGDPNSKIKKAQKAMCGANIGPFAKRPTKIYLGRKKDCVNDQPLDIGRMTHELGHALGLIHEHLRRFREVYVTINWDNIQRGTHSQYGGGGGVDRLLNSRAQSDYDYLSIMHYSPKQGANSPRPTIEPAITGLLRQKEQKDEYGLSTLDLGQRNCISKLDQASINTLYKDVPQRGPVSERSR